MQIETQAFAETLAFAEVTQKLELSRHKKVTTVTVNCALSSHNPNYIYWYYESMTEASILLQRQTWADFT